MAEDDAAAIVSVTFRCGTCGGDAEVVQLVPTGTAHEYSISSAAGSGSIVFDGGSTAMALEPSEYARIRAALRSGSASTLYAIHPRWAAMYCNQCDQCYCERHWSIEKSPDPMSDSYSMHYDTYGTCPAGHRRLMSKDSAGWA